MTKAVVKVHAMSKTEMINHIWLLNVFHTRMQKILSAIQECHKSYFRHGEKVNMFICGETGLGKTTICRNYLSQYPRSEDEQGLVVPVLYTKTPDSPTPKGLLTQILDDLKDPAAHKGLKITKQARLKALIRLLRVQLIIIDELQHMIDLDKEEVLKNASNLLKTLIEDLQVPIIMVGLPESVRVFESNYQLSRRVSKRAIIKKFEWEYCESSEFLMLLKTIEEGLPFIDMITLASENVAKRIYYASNGIMDHIMKLIRHAAENAVEHGSKKVDFEHFSYAFENHISAMFPKKFNPFERSDFELQLEIGLKDKEIPADTKKTKTK